MRLAEFQNEYLYKLYLEIEGVIPKPVCREIFNKAKNLIDEGKITLVNHEGLGTDEELDGAGKYFHYIFKGGDIRDHFPELVVLYHCLLPQIALVTCSKAVLSPYRDSDINIKAYPPGGGTIGWHYDTNTITALLYLTSNTEAPLEMEIRRSHPSKPDWVEKVDYHAREGSLFLMQGRKVWHQSRPTEKEYKMVVVLNYYTETDQWRPSHFDDFVYGGKKQP